MRRAASTIVLGALVLAVAFMLLSAASPAVSQERPPSLGDLAKLIRDGEIDVGEEYGMGEDQRFHVIHADVIDLSCRQCHVEEAPYEIAVPFSEDADPVDRRVCLGCHLHGPATPLYDAQE